jgi:hypothetical protein
MTLSNSDRSDELSMDEIEAQIRMLVPKAEDYRFVPPSGWSGNLCSGGSIVSVQPDSAKQGSEALIDGDCHTSWVAPLKDGVPEAVIDLGSVVSFDRIVVFAPHTNNRGTGGGNNSVRRIGVAVSGTFDGPWQEIETGEVEGPAPMCFKTGGGQVCTYINSKEPTVFQITPVRARFVRVKLLEAHWSSYAREEWKSSVAISEFMLFNSRHK